MHGIHHSIVKDETNSNYSVIFRWWDVLHGTLRLNIKQADIVIGVPAYMDPQDNKLLNLLILPFRKQREYWRLTDGKQSERRLLSRAKESSPGLTSLFRTVLSYNFGRRRPLLCRCTRAVCGNNRIELYFMS